MIFLHWGMIIPRLTWMYHGQFRRFPISWDDHHATWPWHIRGYVARSDDIWLCSGVSELLDSADLRVWPWHIFSESKWGEWDGNGWNTSISLPKWKDQGQVTRVFESLQGDQLAITLRFPPRLWCLHLGPVWCTPQRTCWAEHEPSRAGMRKINGPCKVRHILVLLSVLLGWRPFGLCSDQRKPVDSPGWLCKIHPLCNSTSARNTWEHSPKRCSLHGPLLLCCCKASTLQFFWV